MKQLILDHFRRWWWVLALGTVYAIVLGWTVAMPDDYSRPWNGKSLYWLVWLKVQGRMYVMNTFCLATFTGAILLAFDLQRGLARTVTALPMTARQMGRGWWLATAGIPAAASMVLLFLGAVAFYLFHPGSPFPLERVALTCLLAVLWYATGFTIYMNKPTVSGFGATAHAGLVNLGVTALLLWMVFGFALSLDAPKSPVKFCAFLASGALLSAIGWSRAGRFDPGRVGQFGWGRAKQFKTGRPGSVLMPLSPAETRDLVPPASGPGAIPFLMKSTFARIFLMVTVLVVYAGLIFRLEGIIKSWDDAVRYLGGMAAVFWVIIFFQLTPVMRHLRYLRTLPISASRLAVVLMAMGMLPLLALGLLVAGAAWLISGSSAAITALGGYVFTLGPATLCICFGVWCGGRLLSSGFLLVILLAAFVLSGREMAVPLSGLIVALCVASSFLLTHYALNHSRHAYLSRSGPPSPREIEALGLGL